MCFKKSIYFISLSFFFGFLQASLPHIYLSDPYSPTVEFHWKGGNRRTIAQVGTLIPLHQSEQRLWFSQVLGLWDSQAAKEWNVGLGYRQQLANWIAGTYGFFDKRLSVLNHYHSQISWGVELLGENLEVRLNGYMPITGAKVTSGVVDSTNRASLIVSQGIERSLGGFDVEVGKTHLPERNLQGFLTYYYFNARDIKAIHGLRCRGQWHLTPYMALTGEISCDRLRQSNWFVGIQIKLNGRAKGKPSQMTQLVIKDIDIVTNHQQKSTMPSFQSSAEQIGTQQAISQQAITHYPHAIEVTHFIASSLIRDKIQSILIFSAKDMYLKPKSSGDLQGASLIKVPYYDIQGAPACSCLNDWACFVADSYWRIRAVGEGYGIGAYSRGLGGGDQEKAKNSSKEAKPIANPTADKNDQPSRIPLSSGASYHALGHRPVSQEMFMLRSSSTGEDILTKLNHQFNTAINPAMAVVTGISGSGKTQLAIEYIERHKNQYDSICWLYANPVHYQDYINTLALDLPAVCKPALVKTVHSSLIDKGHKKVLWIYDDVPNALVFNTEIFSRKIKNLWSKSNTKLDVLVTSRGQTQWAPLVPIELNLFTAQDTKTYIEKFFKKMPEFHHKAQVESLHELLKGLPVTIGQALHYLNNQAMDIAQYTQMYQAHWHRTPWLEHAIDNLNDYEKSIWIIAHMASAYLSDEAHLLLQMSALLANGYETKSLFRPLWQNEVDHFVKELADYALILPHDDNDHFNLPYMLHKVLRLKQSKDSIAAKCIYHLIEKARDFFNKKDDSTWDGVIQFFPHITSALEWISDRKAAAKCYYDYGLMAIFFGDYTLAKEYCLQALTYYKHHTEQTFTTLIDLLSTLGSVEFDLGYYEDAKAYYNQALAIQKSHYDKHAIELVATLNELSAVAFELDDYEEAKGYYTEALLIQKKHYGDDHIILVAALDNLGAITVELGQDEEARDYYIQALTLRKNYQEEEDTDWEETLSNLGALEHRLGHDKEAKRYYKQVLTLQQKRYGDKDIKLADTFNSLGMVESSLRRYEKAKVYYAQALALKKNHYGPTHIKLAHHFYNLGNILVKLNNDEEARSCYKQALTLQQMHYGDKDIELIDALYNLGIVESKLGQYEEAKHCYSRALALQKRYYGGDYIELAHTLNNLGIVESELGYYAEAKDYYQQALMLQQHYYGEDHIELIDTLNNLGHLEFTANHQEVARTYYGQALMLQQRYYGEESSELIDTLHSLGHIELKLNFYGAAKSYYNQVLTLQKKHYGENHPQLIAVLLSLGAIELTLNVPESAKDYYTQALALQKLYYEETHPRLAEILSHLRLIEQRLQQDKKILSARCKHCVIH